MFDVYIGSVVFISPVCNICRRLLSQYCSSLAVSPAGRWDTNNGYQHHQTGIAGTGPAQLRPDLSILWSPGMWLWLCRAYNYPLTPANVRYGPAMDLKIKCPPHSLSWSSTFIVYSNKINYSLLHLQVFYLMLGINILNLFAMWNLTSMLQTVWVLLAGIRNRI